MSDPQDSLFRSKRLSKVGTAQEGYSDSPIFEDEAKKRYIGKFDDGTREFIFPNEIITGRLAALAGLNVPKFDGIHEYRGETYALFEWIDGSTSFTDRVRLNQVSKHFPSLDVFRQIYCFDFWTGNWDRNLGNLLVRERGQSFDIFLIDHEHSLFDEFSTASGIIPVNGDTFYCATKRRKQCTELPHADFRPIVEQCYQARQDFDSAIGRISSIEDKDIRAAIYQETDELFRKNDSRELLVKTLSARRERLHHYIDCLFALPGGLSEK